ncbi:MAG: hypothetical protein AB8B74_13780, partial [Crocinitomicaceae bacterium]
MKTLLTISLFLFSFIGHSSHLAGGYISYKTTSNLNEYEITLNLYRDCSGVFASDSSLIRITNICNPEEIEIWIPLISLSNVSQYCLQDTGNTECGNTGNFSGFQKAVYRSIVILPSLCSQWNISYLSSDRNNSVNTTGGAGFNAFYIESVLNNLDFPHNSSPTRNTPFPIPYTCSTQQNDLSIFINDPNNDSLVFSLENASYLPSTPIPYSAGYSGIQPITGISIQPNTGQLNFNHNINGNFLISILIKEFATNGILKGSTRLDFNIVIRLCPNSQPTISNVQNFNSFGSGANLSGNTINSCVGDQFCFDVIVTDANSSDSLILSSDIGTLFPGSTFTQTGFNPSTGSVCWTHQVNDKRAIFSISSNDNNCPEMNTSSKSYLINISEPIEFSENPLYLCDTSTVYNLIDNVTTSDYYWYDLNGNLLDVGTDISCNPCASAQLYFEVDTNIIASNNVGSCLISDTLSIKSNSIPQNFLPDTIIYCSGDSVVLYSPKPELTSIWNFSTIQDSLLVNYTFESSVSLEVNYDGYCSVIDWVLIRPLSTSDLLVDTLIQCNANPNITIAPNDTYWYDVNGMLLDIGTDISCNPCGNPQFLFTTDTLVTKPLNEACSDTDTLYIQPNQSLQNYFSDTIFFCDEDTVVLINPIPYYHSIWHTGANSDTLTIQTDSIQYGSLTTYIDTLICDTKQFLLFSQQTLATISPSNNGLVTNNFSSYQWIFNDTAIIGSNSQTHLPQNNGDYQIYVIDSLGCTDTSNVFIVTNA